MIHIDHQEILNMEKIPRLNLINSCTGYKSANLIGSISADGVTNVAVFSSVTHLGSNPPLLGFVLRPTTVPRNTFKNLKETGEFTVNHIHAGMIADAHHTSAKYPGMVSEFDKTNLEPLFREGFAAPYVEGAKIQIGCKYINEYKIEENGCLFIIGSIQHIYFSPEIRLEDGFLALDKADTVTVNGLDGYSLPRLIDRFEYARPK
ncbi:flavin reductase family protein [Aureitalea sp. L0-47]|uniref:flavin reductase family protein n=1 Tax=Aureitalea sp. L0-47 TaxID=2816962 RepID=UPI002237227E|nr:flavin reductase family protein [Aureitalea sp. L0-47]MCW5519329.1 flavin reductase family protein [Aureitalea sp. L0-47]